jgi:hypothetical protein
MFHSHTLLLTLPISNEKNHNITKHNNNKISPYYQPFLKINITPLYISLPHTIITLTNYKSSLKINITSLYISLTHTIITLTNIKPFLTINITRYMFHSNTLLLSLPISNQANHNIKQNNNNKTTTYFKSFLTINMTSF